MTNGSRSTYVELDCCQNCRFVFVQSEIDCNSRFFCTEGAPPRPLCGWGKKEQFRNQIISIADWASEHGFSSEDLFGPSKKIVEFHNYAAPKMKALSEAWKEWAKDRRVKAWGHCIDWKEQRIIDRPGVKFEDLEKMDCPFKPYEGCKEEWEKNETKEE